MGMRTGADVSNDVILTCPKCGREATVKEWDDNTYRQCTTRQMRRDYISLTRKKAYKESSDTYYQCLFCNDWIEGWTFGTESEETNEDIDVSTLQNE